MNNLLLSTFQNTTLTCPSNNSIVEATNAVTDSSYLLPLALAGFAVVFSSTLALQKFMSKLVCAVRSLCSTLFVQAQVLPSAGVHSKFGFLSAPHGPLPRSFDMFREITCNISTADGAYFRGLVDRLSDLGHDARFYESLLDGLSDETLKCVYSTFTFICQKYVRCMGKEGKVSELPFSIGLIWHHSAMKIGVKPSTTYAALVLNNWQFVSPEAAALGVVSLDSITTTYTMTGSQDEEWFYKIHVVAEAVGAEMLHQVVDGSASDEALAHMLAKYAVNLRLIADTIKRMNEHCDPDYFWNNIRCYLSGNDKPQDGSGPLSIAGSDITIGYAGGSGAQSTLFQVADEFLGVRHEVAHAREVLVSARSFMPAPHLAFLARVKQHCVRARALASRDERLQRAYNECVAALTQFRKQHSVLVHRYVLRFIDASAAALQRGDVETYESLQRANVNGSGGTGGTHELSKLIDALVTDTAAAAPRLWRG